VRSFTRQPQSLKTNNNETLDAARTAPASSFSVSVDGAVTANPTTVAVGAKTVSLTLAQPVLCDSTVAVSYTDLIGVDI